MKGNSTTFLSALFVILVAELFYREPLYNWSLDYIADLQATWKSTSMDLLFTTASGLTEIENFYLAILIALAFKGTQHGFYCMSFVCVIWSVKNFGKLAYHDPRPYMTDDRIIALGCEREFGNPSGHTTQSSAITVFLVLDLLSGKLKRVFIMGLIGAVCVFSLVGFARVY